MSLTSTFTPVFLLQFSTKFTTHLSSLNEKCLAKKYQGSRIPHIMPPAQQITFSLLVETNEFWNLLFRLIFHLVICFSEPTDSESSSQETVEQNSRFHWVEIIQFLVLLRCHISFLKRKTIFGTWHCHDGRRQWYCLAFSAKNAATYQQRVTWCRLRWW